MILSGLKTALKTRLRALLVYRIDMRWPQIALVAFSLVLASFARGQSAKFPKDFVFGVANAPAQVEDGLNDMWVDWARLGNVRSWTNTPQPNERLSFWSHPEIEVDLAHELGVNGFRMGLDWGRLMPTRNTLDVGAMNRYRDTIRLAKSRGMKVMLTLWHHDVPKWVLDSGGWHNPENAKSFIWFATRMIQEFHGDVEWFVTFNEANVFVLNSYISGSWPPGEKASPLSIVPWLHGSSVQVLDMFAWSHNAIYEWAHAHYGSKVKLGLAHNMANYRGKGFIENFKASQADLAMNWHLPQMVAGHMDFFGMNYYGAEWLKGNSIDMNADTEYSEAGRAVDTRGLYDLLVKVHSRYPSLPIIMTENGIADATDSIRPAYLIEHLLAIRQAQADGVPVAGYFTWTLTDNFEWADGYCPKFGLVAVDRTTMVRTPRPSFKIYSQIINAHEITGAQRASAWQQVRAVAGKPRPMCRAADGSTALDVPRMIRFSRSDWRFK